MIGLLLAVLIGTTYVRAQVPTLRLPSVEIYGKRREVFRPLGDKRDGVLWEPGMVQVSEVGRGTKSLGRLPEFVPMRSRPSEVWEPSEGKLEVEAEGGNLSFGGRLSGGKVCGYRGGMIRASYRKALEDVRYPGYEGGTSGIEIWTDQIWAAGGWSGGLWRGRKMENYRIALGSEVSRGDIALKVERTALTDSVRSRETFVRFAGGWGGTTGRWRWEGRGCWESAGGLRTGSVRFGIGTAVGKLKGRVGIVWVGKERGGWLAPWCAADFRLGRKARLFLLSSPGAELIYLKKRLEENPFLDISDENAGPYLREQKVDLLGGLRASSAVWEFTLFLRYADVDGFPIWKKAGDLWGYGLEKVHVEELRGFGFGSSWGFGWEVRAVARRARRTDGGRVPYLPDVEGIFGVSGRAWGMRWQVQGSYFGPRTGSGERWMRPLFLLDLAISRVVGQVEVFMELRNVSGEREGIWEDEPLPGREFYGGIRWDAVRGR